MNAERLRREMVATQLEGRGIRERRLLDAFLAVPRERFVPRELAAQAYDDCPLPVGEGQTISQPYMVALMTEALAVAGGEKVLEVGTGSGYQAAILAALGCRVCTVERIPALLDRALATLAGLGYSVKGRLGDGTLGWEEEAPFDGIVVTAGGPAVPPSLRGQLSEAGRLVVPVGDRFMQELVRVTRTGAEFPEERLGGCRFVPLVGKEGWPEGDAEL